MYSRVGVALLCLLALGYTIEIVNAAPTPSKKRTSTRTRSRTRTPSRTRSRTPSRTRSRTPSRTRLRTPLRTPSPLPCKAGPFPILSTLSTSNFFATSESVNGEAYRFAQSRTGNWKATYKADASHYEYVEVNLGGAYHIQKLVLSGGPFANAADASLVTVESYDSLDDGVFTTLAFRVAPREILLTNRRIVARYIRFTVLSSSHFAGLKGEVYVYPANLFLNAIPPVLGNRPGPVCLSKQPFPLLELLSPSAFTDSSPYVNPPSAFTRSLPRFWLSSELGSTYATFSVNLGAFYTVHHVEVSGGPFGSSNGAVSYRLEYSPDGQEWYSYGGSPSRPDGNIAAGQNGQYLTFTPSSKIRVMYLRFTVKSLCTTSSRCYSYPALKGEVYVLPGSL